MKRLLVVLLILAMVLPMGLVAQAEEPAKKSFYALTADEAYASDFDYMYRRPHFWSSTNVKGDVLDVSWNGAKPFLHWHKPLRKSLTRVRTVPVILILLHWPMQ